MMRVMMVAGTFIATGCGKLVTCDLDDGAGGTLCYDGAASEGYTAKACADAGGVSHEGEPCSTDEFPELCTEPTDGYVIFGDSAETCSRFNGEEVDDDSGA